MYCSSTSRCTSTEYCASTRTPTSQIQVYRYRVRTYHTCSELLSTVPYPASPTEPLGTLTNRIMPGAPLRRRAPVLHGRAQQRTALRPGSFYGFRQRCRTPLPSFERRCVWWTKKEVGLARRRPYVVPSRAREPRSITYRIPAHSCIRVR